ncbi:MAG TPA: hypothetical protein VGO89_01085, partial [Streptomyces sp.]|nr:hypothetical protein [Streptomyces sp.]
MDLDEVAEELYALRPQAFTAARNEQAQRARRDGQRELAEQIRALHRPTLAAWASNLLVREQRETVAPLLRLGTELRGAHRNLDGEELRALSRQQHELVSALTRQAGQLASDAGAPLGPQAQQELAQTLHAVLADPDAAEEWAAGRLSKPLSAPVGFDAAAREAAAAPARRKSSAAGVKESVHTGRGKAPDSGEARARQQKREAAERAKTEARQAADQARRLREQAEAARRDAQTARTARQDADERHGQLRGELREAEHVLAGARKDEREAERAEREARKAAEKA